MNRNKNNLGPLLQSPIYNTDVGNNGIDIFENKLLGIIEKYPDANLMFPGNFNARCGTHQDVLLNNSVELIFDDDTLYEADDFNLHLYLSSPRLCFFIVI